MAKLSEVTDATFDAEVSKAEGAVLVDFWASWCVPCHALAPVLEKIADEYRGRLTVVKFNVDENTAVPVRFGIRGLPTMILFKNGKVLETLAGAHPRESILKAIGKHL